jgi:cation transport protein ChaC
MTGDLHVFAYGSLMWDPGFRFVERRRGLLRGYHRAFCIYSHHYRGTPQNPGLVLGLDRGGACRGIVYRVHADDDRQVRAYLWEREIGNDGVYVEKHLPVLLDDGTTVQALTYVADRAHPQYAGRLGDEKLVPLIRNGVGVKGRCIDYCANTVTHLEELGFRETHLHRLLELARAPQ